MTYRLKVWMDKTAAEPSFFHDRDSEKYVSELARELMKDDPSPQYMVIENSCGREIWTWEKG